MKIKIRSLCLIISLVLFSVLFTSCNLIDTSDIECKLSDHDYSDKKEENGYLKKEAEGCSERNEYWYACIRCGASAGDDSDAIDKWYYSNQFGSHELSDKWISDNGTHFKKCTSEGCNYIENSASCSGGAAENCTKKAICSVCHEEYGDYGSHVLDTTTYGYSGADGHAHKCIYCDFHQTPTAHTPTKSDSADSAHLVCSEESCKYPISDDHTFTVLRYNETVHWYECDVCGAEKPYSRANHFGGKADCISAAVCSYCDISYGELTAHKYEQIVTVKPTTFNEGKCKYVCKICADSYESVIPATKSLKILSIGNSFSQDAMEHLYIVAKAAGIKTIVLGNLYKGGCSLQTHLSCMTNNTESYTFYISSDEKEGMTTLDSTATAKFAIEYTDWDFITLQQASGQSGVSDSYSYLDAVIDYVNTYKNPEAKLIWHMTWAYQGNSTHSSFPTYQSNQLTMYQAILTAVSEKILTRSDIYAIIPSGTTIQNLRTSHLGDNLTRDGYHLSGGIGRYAAALTYLAAITGYDIRTINAVPSAYPEIAEHLGCIKEAVTASIASPYSVTPSSYKPEEKLLNTTLSALADEDKEFLSANGYDPNKYMLLDLEILENAYFNSTGSTWNTPITNAQDGSSFYYKYICTQAFSRAELITGSIIRVDSGYQYRPDGWVSSAKTSTDKRPSNSSAKITVIDSSWWGDFEYRAFNISSKSSGKKIYSADASAFRIYIPVAQHTDLTAEDRSYLSSLGLNADEYKVLDFEYMLSSFYNSSTGASKVTSNSESFTAKFFCTEILSRYDLTIGTVIRLASEEHKYRPEGWTDLDKNTQNRPVTTSVTTNIVDEAWWANFLYRAFNVSRNDEAATTDSDITALRIYVKISD